MKKLSEEEIAEIVQSARDLLKDAEGLKKFINSVSNPFKDLEWQNKSVQKSDCDHGVVFDEEEYRKHQNMPAHEVQKRWPGLFGKCPKGCGFDGIGYASSYHFIAGDW